MTDAELEQKWNELNNKYSEYDSKDYLDIAYPYTKERVKRGAFRK